ncbi:cell wall-active antibiotics response protein LiaF [Paenibacillus sp. JX-17]|uniref:Cell wall-active antibiotics response protein LiaF n=1 Tax=Paenibacillus lacisoli TaxID=3064525 RepID=A0ABT9CJ16_9BACL|nr:cell wall-active antibiotics response protein LiaF [Paenibacillus sp. JX-17]MDO7908875.1 cell wall-active antibiotics response protein LiaF [Paenibacillus sp. JX-17]
MEKRKTVIAITIIAIGLMMLLGKWLSFLTIAALALMLAGFYQMRSYRMKPGYTLMGLGGLLLVLDHLMLAIAIVLISLGIFYLRGRRLQPREGTMVKQNFMSNYDWDAAPWSLRSMSIWHVLGEMDVDLSLAIPEERNTTIYVQGIMGDVDLMLPEYYGVEIESFILFGKIQFGHDQDSGMMNRLVWRSANYEQAEFKVKFVVSYLVGDVNIKIL